MMMFPGQRGSHRVMTVISTNGSVKSACGVYKSILVHMMTSSNGNIFCVTAPLWGKSTGRFPSQSPVTQSFDVFSDLPLNKRLSKQTGRRWFETPSCSIWRHYNGLRTDDRPGEMEIFLLYFLRFLWLVPYYIAKLFITEFTYNVIPKMHIRICYY